MNISLQRFLSEITALFTAPLFELGEEVISLVWIFKLLFSLLVVACLTSLIKRFLKHRLLGRLGIDPGNREALATLVSYAVGTIGLIVVVQASGFDLATFAVIAGGLGVGIGFGLQDITKNLISGITLLIERKLKVGDFIEFEETTGYIEEISIRSAVIRTLAGEEVIVPNSHLVENKINNKSYRSFTGRITLAVGVAYGSDPVLVTEVLLNSACTEPDVLETPPPKVIFLEFGDSALNFELWAWVSQIDREVPIKSSLYFRVEHNLRAADITIPFPQRDIWIKNTDEISATVQMRSQDGSRQIEGSPSSKPIFLKDLLRQVSYFRSLSDLHLRRLIEMGYRKHLEASNILFHQGDRANAFCLILQGAIEAHSKQGEIQIHLFTFSTGQFFGELPLMLDVPYPTTMQAASETILFMVSEQNFGNLLHAYPELAEAVVQELAKRREVLEAHQKDLNGADAVEADKNPVTWVRRRLKTLFNY